MTKAAYLATAIAAAVCLSGTAHAAVLERGLDEPFTFDFRAGSSTPGSVSGPNGSFAASGTTAGLSGSGDISRTADGLGIDSGEGDEGRNVENTIGRTESLTVNFESPFNLKSIGFTNAGSIGFLVAVEPTRINLDIDGSELKFFSESFSVDDPFDSFDPPDRKFNTDGEGRTTLSFANKDDVAAVTSITFSTEQFGSYAVAGISEVPLPASAWLMISLLGAFGGLGRLARRKRCDAANA